MSAVVIFDLVGVFVFAVSGATAAKEREMDVLGMMVLAVATGLGGGTLRSVLTGDVPAPLLVDPLLLGTCSAGTVFAFFAHPLWERHSRVVSIFDALGLGVFVCLGIKAAQNVGLEMWSALLMGIVSGTFGGLIRDVLRNEIPLLLRREIYATAAAFGGVIFLGLERMSVPTTVSIFISTVIIASIRIYSIKRDLHLPR